MLVSTLAGLLLGPGTPPDAHDGHPIEIGWSAPAACPDAEWARGEVERFVGDSLQQTRATQLSFEVSIAADPTEGWVASIVTITEGGRRRRTLPHSDCEQLSEAAALIIAMAIDPAAIDVADETALGTIARARPAEDESAPPPPEDPTPTEPTPTEPEPEPEPEPGPEPEPPPPRPGRFADRFAGPRLALDLGVGRLPTLDLGGTAGLMMGVGPLRLELLGGAWAPRSVTVQGDAGARFWAWSIALRTGWAFTAGRRVELPLMLGVDLGQIRAEGRGLEAATRATPPIGHLHLVPAVQVWVVPSLAILAELDASVPWARPAFTVDGSGTVFRAPVMGIHAGVGVVARFPRRPSSP